MAFSSSLSSGAKHTCLVQARASYVLLARRWDGSFFGELFKSFRDPLSFALKLVEDLLLVKCEEYEIAQAINIDGQRRVYREIVRWSAVCIAENLII